jgi:hypothetical protein
MAVEPVTDYSQLETKELNKDKLLGNEQFIEDAQTFLIERGGYTANDVQKSEDVYDAYMEHFRYQNVNEYTASRDLIYAQTETDDAGKARMGRLMNTFDRMDSDLGWEAAKDYLGGVFSAPSTYAGIFTFGAGKAGALAANQGIKFGLRQALKQGGLRAAVGSAAVDTVAAAGTIAAQEQTRVETIDGKDEIDWANVGVGAAISTVASGSVGLVTGTKKALSSFAAEEIAINTIKAQKTKILQANNNYTKKVFLGQAKGMTDAQLKAVKESAKDLKKKLSLAETIPEELAEGKQLKQKLTKDEVWGVNSKGMEVSLDEKHLENIAAAGARVYHLIPPRFKENGEPFVKGSKGDLEERFSSRITRGITSGGITPEMLGKVLKEHNVTVEQLGYLYAEEISRAGRVLGSQGILKKQQKALFKEMNEIDAKLYEMGDFTSTARKVANDQAILGMGSIGKGIVHLNKARIGMMTIQLATTARNTTNGYMRNYVYALDNLGAGLYNIAKGNISKIKNASDKVLKEQADIAVRTGVSQMRNATQAVFLKDLVLGMNSNTTEALVRLYKDPTFGRSDQAKYLFKEMGDVGMATGTETGLVGVARFLNGFNTMSDNMFKRAIFSRELDAIIYGQTGQRLQDVLKSGKFGSIDPKALSEAANRALDFTYQTGKFKGKGGFANETFDYLIKAGSTVPGSFVTPFPRYLVNQFRFIYEHTPVLGMINTAGILNKTDTAERFGKQIGGLTTLYAMLQMRANLGDENTTAFEYNTPQMGPLKSNGYYDARANLGPFSAFAVAADYLYKLMPNVDKTTYKINIGDMDFDTLIKQNPRIAKDVGYSSRDLIYALTGGQGRGGTGLQFIDAALDIGQNGINMSEEQWQEPMIRFLADTINTVTVGAGVIKDLVATVDPDFRKVPDNTDVSLFGYFMKQATRSFPQTTDPNVDGLLGYKGIGPQRTDISEKPTRSGGTTMTNPLLKLTLGLSEQEEKTLAEKELTRLNLEYFEYAPRKIKLDGSLGNKAKAFMGKYVENQITSYLQSDDYNDIPSDFEKRLNLKRELHMFRQKARDAVLDPNSAKNDDEILRIHKAKFYDLPKETQKFLSYRYREELRNDGWTEPLETVTGNLAKDNEYVRAFAILERLKESDTKMYDFYTRPTVSGVIKLPQD